MNIERIQQIAHEFTTCNDDAKGLEDKILTLFSPNQQRELLRKWWEYFDKESVAVNCNSEERDSVIDDFLIDPNYHLNTLFRPNKQSY